MNGWMRLWIFLSVIWAVTIVGMFGFLIAQTYQDPDGPSVYYQLSDGTRSFYENSKEGEGPTYEATERLGAKTPKRAKPNFAALHPNCTDAGSSHAKATTAGAA